MPTVAELEKRMAKIRNSRASYRKDGYMRADAKRKLQSLGAKKGAKKRKSKKRSTSRRRRS